MINFWVAISEKFADNLVLLDSIEMARDFPLLDSASDDAKETLLRAADPPPDQDPFKPASIQGVEFQLHNCYSKSGHKLKRLERDFKALERAYPLDFFILGAWHFAGAANGKGLEVGTRWESGGVRGAPIFIQPPELDRFMRDGILQDKFMISGQAPRMLSPI